MVEALQPLLFYAAVGVVLYDVMILRGQKPYGIKKADVFAYILILLYMQKVFRRILKVNVVWRAGSVSYMKLLRVINRPIEMQGELQNNFEANGKIIFSDVSFGYLPDRNIFSNFTFEIPPNSITHIHGKSGSGKSTLLKLILGLYPPSSGKIFLDELDYHLVSPKNIRKHVTVVSSEIPLTGNTVFKAISYSRAEEKREKALVSLTKGNMNQEVSCTSYLLGKLAQVF